MRESASEEGARSWRRRLERTATALGAEWSNRDEDEDEDSRRRDRILLKAGATSRLVDDMVDGGGGVFVRQWRGPLFTRPLSTMLGGEHGGGGRWPLGIILRFAGWAEPGPHTVFPRQGDMGLVGLGRRNRNF